MGELANLLGLGRRVGVKKREDFVGESNSRRRFQRCCSALINAVVCCFTFLK